MKIFYITKKEKKQNHTYHSSSNLKRAIALCLGSTLIFGLSACNDDSTNEITDAITESAETLSAINPADLAQQQTLAHNHGPFGFRQPGYASQDAYITENIYDVKNLAYYGDWDSNRVYIIDVDNMELLTSVEGTGDGPYGIDQQGANKAYALTRRTESLTVVDNHTLENTGFIELQHKPRSTNFNANTLLSLVSGGDKAMTSIHHARYSYGIVLEQCYLFSTRLPPFIIFFSHQLRPCPMVNKIFFMPLSKAIRMNRFLLE
jgi:hypothetical protein